MNHEGGKDYNPTPSAIRWCGCGWNRGVFLSMRRKRLFSWWGSLCWGVYGGHGVHRFFFIWPCHFFLRSFHKERFQDLGLRSPPSHFVVRWSNLFSLGPIPCCGSWCLCLLPGISVLTIRQQLRHWLKAARKLLEVSDVNRPGWKYQLCWAEIIHWVE